MTKLWSTHSYDILGEPVRWRHVKTTPKQIVAELDDKYPYTCRFSRGGQLPEGAIGVRAVVASSQVLFEDRAQCLRYLAQRAREKADRLEGEIADLRSQAGRWEHEARTALAGGEA